jgi:hypothetical protein
MTQPESKAHLFVKTHPWVAGGLIGLFGFTLRLAFSLLVGASLIPSTIVVWLSSSVMLAAVSGILIKRTTKTS